jgi:CheY-like chemotaxis protein
MRVRVSVRRGERGTSQAFSAVAFSLFAENGLGSTEFYCPALSANEQKPHLAALKLWPMDHAVKVAPAEALKILVVDDNQDAADTLAMLVKCAGHHVEVAYDGPSALLIAEAQQPDVILLDIGLPKVDGYHIACRLRQQPETKDATIIAVTGYGTDGDKARAKAAGFDFHVLKPASATELFCLFRENRPHKPH